MLPRTRTVRFAIGCLTFVYGAGTAAEIDFSGTVTRVFDGDSFLVRPANDSTLRSAKDANIRLQDIDAPEKDQPYAEAARAKLKTLIEGRHVFVDVIDTDKYGRKVAKVYREPDRLDVARTLVHDGEVWVNRRFAKDRSLIDLEDAARAQHIGLWSTPPEVLVPPWEFRREKKKEAEVTAKKEQKKN